MGFRCFLFVLLLTSVLLLAGSCGGLKIQLGTPSEEPLKEFTLEGSQGEGPR